jgi:D-serine deaminase-like pyridoxal phosphate-dependent protein
MDSAYGRLGLPFGQALFVLATVISSTVISSTVIAPGTREWSVANAGLKAFGMDHGNPSLDGAEIWFVSDEHTTFAPARPVGDRVRLVPAHVDPTMAYHERAYLCRGDEVVDIWPIDLRGW